MAENTGMKDLETKVDTMMIVMEKRIQREDQIRAAIEQNDERMKKLEQSMINLTSLMEARQNTKSAGSEEINSSGQIETDSILNDISNKLDRLIACLLQPFPASSPHCDKLSNVVNDSASNSLNDLDEKANLEIDVSCKDADRVVGEIGGEFVCNTSELQGDKVASQLFDEMPKKDQNSYIAYGDLSKSTTIDSIMVATDLLPRKDVGVVQMTYNHKNESKHGHMDFSSKVDATLCVTTSAFVGVNGVEGIRVQTRRKKALIFDPGGELIYVSSFLFAVDLKSWNYSWDDSLVGYDYDDVVSNLEYMVEAREQVDGETGEKAACNWSEFQVTGVAFELFDKMPKRDLVSSNAQLCGEFQHLEWRNQVYQQAFFQDFVEQMKIRRNLNIPGQFGKKALRTSQISAKKTALVDLTLVSGKIYDGGGFICIKECFDEDTSHLIVLLSDGDVHYRLEQWQFLLKGEGEHGEKLVVATGEDFAGNLSEIQFGEVACQLFAEMHERVYRTHITLIWNCTMNRRYDDSLVVFGLVNAMMDMYGWCNELRESHRQCVVMDQRDVVYWNIWFFGCACAELNVIIMNLCYLLRAQGDEDVKPTKISIDVVFSACMNMCWESGQLICASAIQMGLEFWPSVRTSFLYAKYCSVSHEAQNVFQHIVCKDVISWNSIISRYINQEVCAETFQILKQINFSSFSFCCFTHSIQHDGLMLSDTSLGVHDAFNMLFSEIGAKNHVLRVIFVNPEPVAINEVIIGIYQQLLLQEQFISFKKDVASNLARVRKVLGTCIGLKGVLVFNVGGGIEISLCYLLVKDWFMDYRKESELSLLNCKADDVQEFRQTLLFSRRLNSSELQCNRMHIKPLKKPWKDNSRVQTTKLVIERHQKKLFNFTTSSTKAMALEEFLILNVGASSFKEAMTMSAEVYHYFEAAIKNMESCSLPNILLPLGVLHNWTRFSIEAGASLSFGENLPTLNQAHFSSDLEDKVKFDGGSNVMTHRDWYFPMRNDPKAGRQGTIKGRARAAMGDMGEEIAEALDLRLGPWW